jgi:hypothetical protein
MHYIAVSIQVFHALVMVIWILGLPLLFWHRYPKLTIGYACFAIVFIIINQVSHYTLGECVLTTAERWCWKHSLQHEPTEQWFSVRFAQFIFGLTPTHRDIKIASEVLIAISAAGGSFFVYKKFNLRKAVSLAETADITPTFLQ